MIKKSDKKDEEMKKIPEVTTFTIPLTLEAKQENLDISTNASSNPSKEEIINKARKLHQQGNIPEATKYYQSFIKQGFKDFRVFSNYGMILISLGKLKEAELSYRKAIEIKPDYADAHYNLGIILIDLGKLHQAELSIREAIKINPTFAEAHLNLGIILKDFGNLKDEDLSSRKAIEINADYRS